MGDGAEPTRVDHLGIEIEDTEQVSSAITRLAGQGLATDVEENTTCCHVAQDKVWATGPGRERWEAYTVTTPALISKDRPAAKSTATRSPALPGP